MFPLVKRPNYKKKILKSGLLKDGEEYVHERYYQTCRKTDKLRSDTKVSARMREMFMLNFYFFMQCLLDEKTE